MAIRFKRSLGLAGAFALMFAAPLAAQQFSCKEPATGRSTARIVGGEEAQAGAWRWQVALELDTPAYQGQFCGGSLIAPGWVLTAAHCVQDDASEGGPHFTVRHGSQRLQSGGETRTVAEVFPHPGYDAANTRNDIALLKLSAPFSVGADDLVSYMAPGRDGGIAADGNCAVVTGWGSQAEVGARRMRVRSSNDRLRQVDVPIVSTDDCRRRYGPEIDSTQLCAGYESGGKDSCQGDSGGPLVVQGAVDDWTLVGVVSYGNGCAAAGGWYGVYTRVSPFVPWIQQVMTGK